MEPVTAGAIRLDGAAVAIGSPREAMALGVNLVCADRVGESILPGLAVRENFFLNPLAAGLAAVVVAFAAARKARRRASSARRSACVPTIPTLAIELLSGGNQQKVVVGRWLHLEAKVYVFEDPTAGVDVGAKAEIYQAVRSSR